MKESYNRDPLVAAAEAMMLTEDVAKIKKKVAQLEVGDKTNYGTVVAIGSDSITFKAKDTPKTKIVFRQRKMGSPDYLLMNLVKLTPDGKKLDKSFKEANDFTGAAAAAAVAGEDEFEFNGKTYPVEMDIEVAKKIMSQSLKLAKQLAKDMEEDVDFVESNEFVGAAAAAKVAGKDEFEFNGKTYPVEISQETAEKIMSQAIDLAKDIAKAKKEKEKEKEESTELEEEFVVKYSATKRGPIQSMTFDLLPDAKKFLADKEKEGYKGIISKNGKPVKEELEEAAGSLQNSLKVLAKDGIKGRVTDMPKLAKVIHKNYKAITGKDYQDSDQVATSEIIADLIIHLKVNPDKFISAWDNTIKEAKIPSSNISKFSSPEAAMRAAALQKYKTQVFMGDDGKFWVPSTNKEAGQLKKDGYEVYESADLEEATDLTESAKIACLECDEVSTAAAWKKNGGFCPKCKVSSRGVAESVSDDLEEAKMSPEDTKLAQEIIKSEDERVSVTYGQKLKVARQKLIKKYGKDWAKMVESIEEARGFTDSSFGAKQTYDNVISLSKSLKKGSNLNKAVNKRLGGKYDSDFAKMEDAIGLILDTLDEFDREYQMSEGANVAELEERAGEEWFTAETRVKSSGQLYSTFWVLAKDLSVAKKKADDVFRELVKTSYPKDWPSYQKKFTLKVMKGDNLGDIMP
jgi:hypothetical protein